LAPLVCGAFFIPIAEPELPLLSDDMTSLSDNLHRSRGLNNGGNIGRFALPEWCGNAAERCIQLGADAVDSGNDQNRDAGAWIRAKCV
jgi:hypothetical protein